MDLVKLKKVYCLGAGGIGVSAAAKFFLARGKKVGGSDVCRSEITAELEKRGAKIFYGHRAGNVGSDVDLAVYSPAVPADNPERKKIKKLKIRELSYPEFLGELSKKYFTVAVSGTHGKSTTAALIGLMLEAAGFDPLVIVGSRVPGWKLGNIRLPRNRHSRESGNPANTKNWIPAGVYPVPRYGAGMTSGKIFVVEACEHQANMLKIHPAAAVITNIEKDHLDYYKSLKNIRKAFSRFVASVPKKGLAVVNGDDAEIQDRGLKFKTFGINNQCDYRAESLTIAPGRQNFKLKTKNFRLLVPGRFNIYNALAAVAVASELSAPLEICRKILAKFKGIWRRFEVVGKTSAGAIVVSDYGHHPTAVRETIKAAREFYPGRRLVLVFQPHQRHRTKSLFRDFVHALSLPDILILSEIYDVAGREKAEDGNVTSRTLLAEIQKNKPNGFGFYAGNLAETEKLARQIVKRGDVALVMGAGDIDSVARKLAR